MIKEELLSYMPPALKVVLSSKNIAAERLSELRIRAERPLAVSIGNETMFVTAGGELSERGDSAYFPTYSDVKSTLDIISKHSLYAFEDDIRNGFLTLKGGHRAGICGQAVTENGRIKTFRHVSSINLRIAREVKGCAAGVISRIVFPSLKHVMIISPPMCGKTTMLRDAIRLISNGTGAFKGANVGIADERSEIAACYMGIPQNDVGNRTDVIDSAPKPQAMALLLRSMSPQVIAVDEIGGSDDINAVFELANAGIKVICTVHGNDLDDVLKRPRMKALMEAKIFELFVCLGYKTHPGEVTGLYNKEYERFDSDA